MLSKLSAAITRYGMLSGGETVICAVSGGADSMALLWGMWLLKDKFHIQVEAAHFNHHLRGEESLRDEEFVRSFCAFHDIPLHVGQAHVVTGVKGLEAAARDARYGFLRSLDGIIATAHTADDNAETVLMHLIRGTGLRGLGAITPKGENLIRPMLDVTRQEVEAFLAENWINHIEDSSNGSDAFLRNRIRHHIMPLLQQENPSIGQNLSAMAQRLRQEDEVLQDLADSVDVGSVSQLRSLSPAIQRRALERLLKEAGMPEPNASHIQQTQALVQTEKPSAFSDFPGGVILRRNYDRLEAGKKPVVLETVELPLPGAVRLEAVGLEVRCEQTEHFVNTADEFTVCPVGNMVIRCRQAGDEIRLSGGTKSLKKRFVDQKIPASERLAIPVIADDAGVLGVLGLGANLDRIQGDNPVTIHFRKIPPVGNL